jgi:hypothetical protein
MKNIIQIDNHICHCGKLTCKLSFALGCPNGGNNGVALQINQKEIVVWKSNWEKTKELEGPLVEIVLGDGKGEMTLVARIESNALVECLGESGL